MMVTQRQVWIAGKITDCPAWEFIGVFDSEDKAVAVCKTNQYFVAPCVVNEAAPEEARPMPGGYYPLAEAREV